MKSYRNVHVTQVFLIAQIATIHSGHPNLVGRVGCQVPFIDPREQAVDYIICRLFRDQIVTCNSASTLPMLLWIVA